MRLARTGVAVILENGALAGTKVPISYQTLDAEMVPHPGTGQGENLRVFGRNERGDPVGKMLQRLVSSPKAQFRWRNPEENPYIFRIENRNTVTSYYHDVATAMGQA